MAGEAPEAGRIMDLGLDGGVAIVTGATGGIGRAIVQSLAAEGMAVVVNHLGEAEAAETLCEELGVAGGRVSAAEADVGDRGAVEAMVGGAVERFGRLDVMVHNAGVTSRQSILETSTDDWERVLRTNLYGAYHTACAAGRAMIEAGRGGAFIAISSLHGRVAKADMGAYCSSKAAVDMLVKQLAVELAPHGIRANAVAPGTIETDMNPLYHATDPEGVAKRRRILDRVPLARLGEPAAVARTVAFLASPVSSYTTGAVVYVDGGYTADGTPR